MYYSSSRACSAAAASCSAPAAGGPANRTTQSRTPSSYSSRECVNCCATASFSGSSKLGSRITRRISVSTAPDTGGTRVSLAGVCCGQAALPALQVRREGKAWRRTLADGVRRAPAPQHSRCKCLCKLAAFAALSLALALALHRNIRMVHLGLEPQLERFERVALRKLDREVEQAALPARLRLRTSRFRHRAGGQRAEKRPRAAAPPRE